MGGIASLQVFSRLQEWIVIGVVIELVGLSGPTLQVHNTVAATLRADKTKANTCPRKLRNDGFHIAQCFSIHVLICTA
jgi:hypothetical protein